MSSSSLCFEAIINRASSSLVRKASQTSWLSGSSSTPAISRKACFKRSFACSCCASLCCIASECCCC